MRPFFPVPSKAPTALRLLLPLVLLMLAAGLLPALLSLDASRAAVVESAFVTAQDTIDGERISDRALVRRIERVAVGVPSSLLASHPQGERVRYLAQAIGPGDDAPVSHGVFRHPAAALAFGCALDDDLDPGCHVTPTAGGSAAYEEAPGIRCVPMRLALGAPAYEPDRCEAGG